LENREEKKGEKISGSLVKGTRVRRKKNTKNISTGPTQKTEPWFASLFYNFLYYRSEEWPYSPTTKYPKVKLPRSRHK
jgi:hypothetical protein